MLVYKSRECRDCEHLLHDASAKFQCTENREIETDTKVWFAGTFPIWFRIPTDVYYT